MPTYTYQTIPAKGRKAKTYEIEQRMSEAALSVHPQTGEPIQRIITADRGVIASKSAPSCGSDCGIPGSGGGCCGGGCGLG